MTFPSDRRVYIAAPKEELGRALHASAVLRGRGVAVVSTWHDTYAAGTPDPHDEELARRILAQNQLDLAHATHVLALPHATCGREMYVEVGRALERGRIVAFSNRHGGLPLSWADGNADVYDTDEAAINAVSR